MAKDKDYTKITFDASKIKRDHKPPNDPLPRKRLLKTLISLPSVENAYRQWDKDNARNSYQPSGEFDEFEKEYNSTDRIQEREEKRKNTNVRAVDSKFMTLDYKKHWAPELLTKKDIKALGKSSSKPKFKPSGVILIKKDKKDD